MILPIFFTGLFSQQSPNEFFNTRVGSDRTLIKYPDMIRYFKYLDSFSERIKLIDQGQSTLGNSIHLAAISSAENIKQIEELCEINKKLANPDTLSRTEAQELINKGKTFVLITCAIHATEIASTQMSLILAHKLTNGKDPIINGWLEDVVLLLMPSINPDGNILVTEWYEKYVNTEFEGSRMPYLYHHYAGHDNNRDFYMLNLKETRVVNAVLHHRYFPHIYLDMHQMQATGPRMFVPPFKDPLNQNLDPVLMNETNIIGGFMALRLQEKKKQGVGNAFAFDAYWPGGSKNTAWYKNVVGILTEMASVNVASPIYVEPNELESNSKGLPEYRTQVNFPDPWPGGWWRLDDIMTYEIIAVEALLEIAAKNRESFLANFFEAASSNLKRGENDPPFGYVVPKAQWDQPAACTFLKKMHEHGIRLYELSKDAIKGNLFYHKGDVVIPLNQPYGNFVRVMMENQRYPEIKYWTDGPIIEPYDATGWTMPLQMGVKTMDLNYSLSEFEITRLTAIDYPEETIQGTGNFYRFPARYNRSVIPVNRLLQKKITVYRHGPSNIDTIDPGDYLVSTQDIGEPAMKELIRGSGISPSRIQLPDGSSLYRQSQPKIGIYQSYRASMDEGWTRWVLDHFEFRYHILHNPDFTEKKLSEYGIIIFPDQARETIVEGEHRGYWSALASSMPPEYRGGIGKKGIDNLKKFVRIGGAIVLLDSSAELGIKDFELPFYNILNSVEPDKFYCPGSLLKLRVDTLDPIGWGLEENSFIFFSQSPAFRTRPPVTSGINRKVIAGFNETGPHLISGYLKGESILNRKVMIIRFDYHRGQVLVLGGRIQHRAQTFGTFKFLFNSLYFPAMQK